MDVETNNPTGEEHTITAVQDFARASRLTGSLIIMIFLVMIQVAAGQTLRYSNHREVAIPDYATLRIGPFYSMLSFSQSAGYRYVTSSGTGVDFLYGNRLGEIHTNGSDFPLVSRINMRNYLLMSRHSDVDLSLSASYAHYPLDTQDDEFIFDLADEGILGNISFEFRPTPFVKGTIYNNAAYRTAYVDTRGITDRYGGSKYVHFNNVAGLNMDWLMAEDKNLALSLSRKDVVPMEDAFEDQKSTSYNESIAYEQMLNVFILAGLMGEFEQTTYDSTNRAAQTSSQTYSAYSNIRLTEWTKAKAMIGYYMSTVSSSPYDYEEDSGVMIGSASLETQLGKDLKHSFGWARSRGGGFTSEFETADEYYYRLRWRGDISSAELFSTLSKVNADRTSVNAYSDWSSGIMFDYPVFQFMILKMVSTYSVRKNESVAVVDSNKVEWTNDYATWVSELGTSFPITREVSFRTSVQHIERDSDSSDLAYQMDIFAADFVYTHVF